MSFKNKNSDRDKKLNSVACSVCGFLDVIWCQQRRCAFRSLISCSRPIALRTPPHLTFFVRSLPKVLGWISIFPWCFASYCRCDSDCLSWKLFGGNEVKSGTKNVNVQMANGERSNLVVVVQEMKKKMAFCWCSAVCTLLNRKCKRIPKRQCRVQAKRIIRFHLFSNFFFSGVIFQFCFTGRGRWSVFYGFMQSSVVLRLFEIHIPHWIP